MKDQFIVVYVLEKSLPNDYRHSMHMYAYNIESAVRQAPHVIRSLTGDSAKILAVIQDNLYEFNKSPDGKSFTLTGR